MAGHQGINKTVAALKLRYYWPNLRGDITMWCSQCHICGETKPQSIRHKSAIQQKVSGAPFERVAVDLMGPFECTENENQYIMVIQDYFTKWVIAEPLANKTAITVADSVFTRWVSQYGCPDQLHSDQGREFTAALFTKMCSILRIDKTFTSAYRPQSDGMVERHNRSLQMMLRAYVNENRNDWDDSLPALVAAYRATPHDSTGISPYKMLYGREMVMPVDLQFDVGNRLRTPECPVEYVEWLRQSLRDCHDFARQRLQQSARRQKKAYQEKTREVQFARGDWVWKNQPQLFPGKLYKKNTGPWLILAKMGPVNYKVQKDENSRPKIVHVDKLSRYFPEDDEILVSWIAHEDQLVETASQTDGPLNPTSWTDNSTMPRLMPPVVELPDLQGDSVIVDPGPVIVPKVDVPPTAISPRVAKPPKITTPVNGRPRRTRKAPVRLDLNKPETWRGQPAKAIRTNRVNSFQLIFEGMAGLMTKR